MRKVTSVCVKECCHCCSQIPLIHDAEYEIIRDYVKSDMPPKDFATVKNNLDRWTGYFCANTSFNISRHDLIYLEKLTTKNKIFCPFLVNSLCAIYPVRPITCRTFTVNHDPDLCRQTPTRTCSLESALLRKELCQELSKQTKDKRSWPLAYRMAGCFDVIVPKKLIFSAVKASFATEVLRMLYPR